MNDGQTHGIPIGPDASLVVAEVLLAAADSQLISRLGQELRGFRYIDDYELCFRSLSEAEAALSHLQAVLADFELSLNPRKTRIVALPHRFDSEWANELKSLQVRQAVQPVGQRNDLLSFFSRAFSIAESHPTDSVLRYAVAHVQGLDVAPTSWRTFHNCVLGAASADASTLPFALGTLFSVAERGNHEIPRAPLAEVLESVIARHAPRAQGSEVAWALWAAIAWQVSLSDEVAKLIESMEDDLVALLAMHAAEEGVLAKNAFSPAQWAAIVADADVLLGEHWLLAYESNQQGWLQVPSVADSPEFAAMAKAGVSFYDRSNAVPQFPEAGRAVPGGSVSSKYA